MSKSAGKLHFLEVKPHSHCAVEQRIIGEEALLPDNCLLISGGQAIATAVAHLRTHSQFLGGKRSLHSTICSPKMTTEVIVGLEFLGPTKGNYCSGPIIISTMKFNRF